MDTQWRFTGEGARTGLDYGSLETVARLNGISLETGTIMADLRVMERTAIGVFQKQRLQLLRELKRRR